MCELFLKTSHSSRYPKKSFTYIVCSNNFEEQKWFCWSSIYSNWRFSRSTSNGRDVNSSSIEDCTIIVCTDFHSIRIERLHKDELCKGTPLGSQARPMIHSTWGKTQLEISSDSCCIVGISKGKGEGMFLIYEVTIWSWAAGIASSTTDPGINLNSFIIFIEIFCIPLNQNSSNGRQRELTRGNHNPLARWTLEVKESYFAGKVSDSSRLEADIIKKDRMAWTSL